MSRNQSATRRLTAADNSVQMIVFHPVIEPFLPVRACAPDRSCASAWRTKGINDRDSLERGVEVSISELRAKARGRLIFPLDFNNREDALAMVKNLGDSVTFYKVGYVMLLAEGPEFWQSLRTEYNKNIFYDCKINDIDETVESAIRTVMPQLVKHRVELLTVNGNVRTVKAAYRGRGELRADKPKIVHVTHLSSQDAEDLEERYGVKVSLSDFIRKSAEKMLDAGGDGVIASGESVRELREAFKGRTPRPLIVVPGIRPSGTPVDDHKRTLTPAQAIEYGADYLVVGRPIKNAPDPAAAAEAIVNEMAEAYRKLSVS